MCQTQDHHKWSRRQFLFHSGIIAAGSMLLGNMPVAKTMANPLTTALHQTETDKIIVFLKLNGGNDGLNMVIPHHSSVGNSVYRSLRPNLAQIANQDYNSATLLNGVNHTTGNSSDQLFALPDAMNPLMPLWDNQQMAIVHNVGYMDQNFSHFTSSDIWATNAENDLADPRRANGSIGRYYDYLLPSFLEAPLEYPPALVIGGSSMLNFRGVEDTQYDLVFSSPAQFYQTALSGQIFSTEGIDTDCYQGEERIFLRNVANNAFRYGNTIKEAYNQAMNNALYANTNLSEKMGIIARLIKGGLPTKAYWTSIDGFDTHAMQKTGHATLLEDVAWAIHAFYEDLAAKGMDKRVIVFAYSEFGRTVTQNGNTNQSGTDHGTVSPMMIFGSGIQGGFYGSFPHLVEDIVDYGLHKRFAFTGNSIDFRSIYAALLRDWWCMHPDDVALIMGDNYFDTRLNQLIGQPCTPQQADQGANIVLAHIADPNNNQQIEIKYAMRQNGSINLTLLANQEYRLLAGVYHKAGSYTFYLNKNDFPTLLPGDYTYVLEANGETVKRSMRIF